MTALAECLREAAALEARGDGVAAHAALGRAVEVATDPADRFDALLLRARAEATLLAAPSLALESYDQARRVAKASHLPVVGEADLGMGMALLALGRVGEGVEAVRRAERGFRRRGDTFRRGCALVLLAEQALGEDEPDAADKGLEVACDLLAAAGDALMLSKALTLRAGVAARAGAEGPAELLLREAAQRASEVASDGARHDLAERRRAVRRQLVASAAERDGG